MITLQLGDTIPRRGEPSQSGLQTLSEMVESLEPPPVVLQALSETVAWCLRRSVQHDQFRSSELDPSALLNFLPFDDSNIEVWLERKHESYRLAVCAINANRSAVLRDANIDVADRAVAEAKGRLLQYETLETVTDGASDSSSHDFFDIEGAPPWETRLLYSTGSIFSWAAEAWVQNAQVLTRIPSIASIGAAGEGSRYLHPSEIFNAGVPATAHSQS